MLEQLEETSLWDIIVIGGGATGLGIALESVSRGYKTLLVEQSDFAKSTSGKSTKLVHGGVRYLAQGNIALVHEASIERHILCNNAPHLVKNQTFIIPVYSIWDALKYTVGLKLYDWMAGRLSLGSSVFISKSEVLRRLPQIRQENLSGGILYHDGQFDDARLAINLAQTIAENGGTVLNYVKVTGLIKNENGIVTGAMLRDIGTKKEYRVNSTAVVNATGVFVDEIMKMDDTQARNKIAVSRGIHLVVDRSFSSSDDAIMIPKTSDGRVLFLIPWHDKLVIGTTDTPANQPSLEPTASESEIEFILENTAAYLTKKPERKDILSVFAGLRPLAAPKEGKQKTKEISRSHKIEVSAAKLFTIIGGKWTTYRRMGEDMVNCLEKQLPLQHTRSRTAEMPIHGYLKGQNFSNPFYFYGSDEIYIREKLRDENEWISKKLNLHKAQVLWSIENEMACTVDDMLSRRTRCLLLDAKESLRIAPAVAELMAEAMGKNEKWIEEQLSDYSSLTKNYILS
jgi:glycerol-3-phosphate dehydrogenase